MEYRDEQLSDYLNSLDKKEPELIKCDFCGDGVHYKELEEIRTTIKEITYVEQACKGCLKEMRHYEKENNL